MVLTEEEMLTVPLPGMECLVFTFIRSPLISCTKCTWALDETFVPVVPLNSTKKVVHNTGAPLPSSWAPSPGILVLLERGMFAEAAGVTDMDEKLSHVQAKMRRTCSQHGFPSFCLKTKFFIEVGCGKSTVDFLECNYFYFRGSHQN